MEREADYVAKRLADWQASRCRHYTPALALEVHGELHTVFTLSDLEPYLNNPAVKELLGDIIAHRSPRALAEHIRQSEYKRLMRAESSLKDHLAHEPAIRNSFPNGVYEEYFFPLMDAEDEYLSLLKAARMKVHRMDLADNLSDSDIAQLWRENYKDSDTFAGIMSRLLRAHSLAASYISYGQDKQAQNMEQCISRFHALASPIMTRVYHALFDSLPKVKSRDELAEKKAWAARLLSELDNGEEDK